MMRPDQGKYLNIDDKEPFQDDIWPYVDVFGGEKSVSGFRQD